MSNRTIWIWRIIAVLILFVCALLFLNLYSDLISMQKQRPANELSQPAPASPR